MSATQIALHERVWGLLRFSELSPNAAANALKNDCLFASASSLIQFMNPITDNHLYHSDGTLASLTITERAERFPLN